MDIRRTIALQARILISCIVLFYHFQRTLVVAIGSDITVEASMRGTPFNEGEVLAFLCDVKNMPTNAGFKVTLSRTVTSDPDKQQILAIKSDDQLFPPSDDRAFLATRQHIDGSVSYLLSITDIALSDEGRYFCTVDSHDREADYFEDFTDVKIQYFPNENNLHCSPRNSFVVNEGESFSMFCETDIGYPAVTIEWTKTGSPDDIVATSTAVSNTTVFSTLNITANVDIDGAIFMCKFTSDAFPMENSKQCFVGPLIVLPGPKSTHMPGHLLTLSTDEVRNNVAVGSLKCDSCSTHHSSLYWIAAGVVAGVITTILFICDILLIIKLKKLRASWGVYKAYPLTPSVAETNYMYLPRPNQEGDRTYMTLERTDPQQSNYSYGDDLYGLQTPTHYAISPGFDKSQTPMHYAISQNSEAPPTPVHYSRSRVNRGPTSPMHYAISPSNDNFNNESHV